MIVDGNVQNILGKKSCSELKLVKHIDTIEKCITDDYADAAGMCQGYHTPYQVGRECQTSSLPTTQSPGNTRVKYELDRMETLGVTERVHEPSD